MLSFACVAPVLSRTAAYKAVSNRSKLPALAGFPLLILPLYVAQVWADTPVTELDEIVVISHRVAVAKSGLQANTTVITAADIAKSPAQTLPALLASQAGVQMRGSDGSDDKAIDLRGFGASGASNTLILINGVRQNDNDLSSVRISQVPLDSIERIEIVRSSGAVQFGGGATGGVINIVTRNPLKAQPSAVMKVGLGSNRDQRGSLQLNVQGDQLGFSVVGESHNGDNFRDNNANQQQSISADLRWAGDTTQLGLQLGGDVQQLGLPGALTYDQWQANPQATQSPLDYAHRRSAFANVNWVQQWGAATFYLDANTRAKHIESHWFSTFGNFDDIRDLRTTSLSPRLNIALPAGEITQALTVGLDRQRGTLDNPSARVVTQSQTGIFAEWRASTAHKTEWSIGLRQQYVRDRLASSVSTNRLSAVQFAGSVPLNAAWTAYAKLGSSFRIANADEQGYTLGGLLRPQRSHELEFGARYQSDSLSARVAAYRINLQDEIHYNPLAGMFGANVNLDPTRRQGVELETAWHASPTLQLTANATLQQATFLGGVNLSGHHVPLVPQVMLNVGAHWQWNAESGLDIGVRHVGAQRLDNDQANSASYRLPAYTVVDVALGQRFKAWSWRLAVRNLFNARYAEYGIKGGTKYSVYPSAERQLLLDLSYQFK